MIAYVDSSALLRRVLGEPGGLDSWDAMSGMVCSALVRVECVRTVDRLRLQGLLTDAEVVHRSEVIASILDEAEIVQVTPGVLRKAAGPSTTLLGTLDAIHLATAVLWKRRRRVETMHLATHDEALGLAARAQGLRVIGVREPFPPT